MNLSLELILGLIGTGTGLLSLVIILLEYIKEKPRIIPSISAFHRTVYSDDGERFVMKGRILVNNIGNKGTDILQILWAIWHPVLLRKTAPVEALTWLRFTRAREENYDVGSEIWANVFISGGKFWGQQFKEKKWLESYGSIEIPIFLELKGTPKWLKKKDRIELFCCVFTTRAMTHARGWSYFAPVDSSFFRED